MATLVRSQNNHFIHTSNEYILGPCGDTLRLKGVNYAPYNWGYTLSDLKIAEIAQTGANAVRLPWYWSNPNATVYYNYTALDSAISKCVQNKMIAIVELHDFTCANNTSSLINGSGWWTNSSVFPILSKYRESVIVNIANEALQVNWTSNPTTALATYKSTYQTIITNLRNVTGFDFPLMIDAPDCGQNSDAFITNNTATDLISFDPKHNLIFSAHAYWYGYAGNDSTQMATKINNVLAKHFPFILGEIANQQDDATMCQYNLNYQPLLRFCEKKKLGWLAWSWDHDGCPNRQMSSNGLFTNLTAYGNDLVNNSVYGLKTRPAAKSQFLLNNKTCMVSTGIRNSGSHAVSVATKPDGSFAVIATEKISSISCYDLSGRRVPLIPLADHNWRIDGDAGMYLVSISSGEEQRVLKILVN